MTMEMPLWIFCISVIVPSFMIGIGLHKITEKCEPFNTFTMQGVVSVAIGACVVFALSHFNKFSVDEALILGATLALFMSLPKLRFWWKDMSVIKQ